MAKTTGRKKDETGYIIYIDTGGTFSDCFLLKSDGSYVVGKASTTPADLSKCFLSSIEAAAGELGKSLDEVLANTSVLGYGTTQGTNIVVTGTGASRLGFITTRGHEDRTLIMRLRPAGLSRVDGMHVARAFKPAPLIPRRRIRGVTERIDCRGKVVIPLREEEVRTAVKELLEEKVEGIVVGLLWSFMNPAHEKRIAEIIEEMAPGMPVSLSSTVAPVIRECSRFMTTIVDLYIGAALKELLERIQSRLASRGYHYPLLVLQAIGGVARADVVKPANTLHSGPVGGLAGVEFLKEVYGFDNAVGCDVGGTSFDVCISPKGAIEYMRESIVGRWEITNPMREITTIGAGGGTMARVEKAANLLIVGPESAGADPGPVCYGGRGTVPTVTDADVVMNRIDPNYFLGGRIKLDRERALRAIKEKIADLMNMDVMAAAEGICNVLDATMRSTLHSALVIKGAVLSNYALFVYGGAGPTHCAGFTKGLNFKEMVVPPFAAAFCAFGASSADIRHRYEASPFVNLAGIPYDPVTLRFDFDALKSLSDLRSEGIERFNRMFAELVDRAKADMRAEGIKEEQIRFYYEIQARYVGQLTELRARVPLNEIGSVEDLAAIAKAWEDQYCLIYTPQAMAPRGGLQIITIAAEALASLPKPKFIALDYVGESPEKAFKGKRQVYFDGSFRDCPIYEMGKLLPGNTVLGPAIIEGTSTNVVVPEDRKILVDKYRNMLMRYR